MASWKKTLPLALVLGVLGPAAALAQNRGAAEVALNRGLQAFQADDYRAAEGHFEVALTHDPEFAAAHYFLGLTSLQLAVRTEREAARNRLLERALSEFEQCQARDPSLVLAYLDSGIAQSILGRFDQAESLFESFIEKRPDDPVPYLFLAIVYYRQVQSDPAYIPRARENLDRADAALNRAERRDPSVGAYINIYRAYLLLAENRRSEAAEAARRGAEEAPETAAGARSQELLERIERGEVGRRRPWDLTLEAGFDYDTNVTLRGERVPRELRSNERDSRFGFATSFAYRLLDTEEFVFGAGMQTFNSWHSDVSPFDVQTYGADVFAGYSPTAANWLTLGLRYDWDTTLVGRKEFLDRHRVTPQIDVRETDWTSTTLFYQLDARQYQQEVRDWRLDRDGDTHAVGLIQNVELGTLFERQVLGSASYRFENASTAGTEFAGENHVFSVGLGVPLPADVTFDFVSEWEIGDYDNRSLFDSTRDVRRDHVNTLIFGLTKDFDEHLSTRLQVEWTQADSNVRDRLGQEPFTYDRIVYGISVIYRF